MVIGIEAPIGNGKTFLAKCLAKFLHSNAYLEKVKHNSVLPKFYKGEKMVSEGKWKHNPYEFLLQIYFLNNRFAELKKAMQNDNNVLDRTLYGDVVFMKLNYDLNEVTKPEWLVYKSLFHQMMQELPYASHRKSPTLMIYISEPLTLELKHIRKRNRPFEQIDNNPSLLKYYVALRKYYDRWFKHYHVSPKMVLYGDKYDLDNPKSRKHVMLTIKHKLIQVRK